MSKSTSSTELAPMTPPTPPTGGGLAASLRRGLRAAFVENAALKFVALVLALTIFVLVQSDENEVYHPWVRVSYSQLDKRVLVSKRVDQVQISVRGTRRRIKRLQKQRLENIHIDLDPLSSGDLRLDPSMFDLPDGVDLISVNPPSVYLEFDDKIEKMLPVQVDTLGLPARGYKLGSLVAGPSELRVSGGHTALSDVNLVTTEKINLTGRTQSFKGDVPIVENGFEVIGTPEVNVSIQIIEEVEVRTLEAKAVSILAPEGVEDKAADRYVVEPASVVITMYGPVHALEAIDAEKVRVYVDLSARDLVGEQARDAELRVDPALSDIAYKLRPAKVTLRPTSKSSSPTP